MKLPEKIKGRNRIRDAAIVLAFKHENLEYKIIAEKFNLTERRILQILSTNHAFIKRDKEWEKEKRISILQRKAQEYIDKPLIGKDITNIIEQLRKEIEGDKPLIETHQHTTYVWQNNSNTLLAPELSESHSRID